LFAIPIAAVVQRKITVDDCITVVAAAAKRLATTAKGISS
jgi:hypothetical protein